MAILAEDAAPEEVKACLCPSYMNSVRPVNLSKLVWLAATLGLVTTANSGDIIKDRSPDGRFALRLSADQDAFELGLVDLASHKELVSLDSLGSPYAKHSYLLWSPDSKRVAYTEDTRRGGYTKVYQQKGDGFEEVKLPELPYCPARHVQKVYEVGLSAQRWPNANTVELLKREGWTTEDGGDGECEKTVTIAFDAKGKASILKVRSASARELADRAKAQQLFESGATKASNGDRAGAIADYTRAIKLDPKNVDAYNNRGTEKQNAGDVAGAFADFSRAIEINPLDPNPYYNRGAIYFLKRDWKKALSDLRRHDELNEEDEDAPPVIWAAQARLGEKEAADRELSGFVADHPEQADPFNTKIENFLLGKISEQDLLAAADSVDEKKRPEQQCEAWYYAGLKRMLNGDKAGAAEAFSKSVATGAKTVYECDFAGAELKDLGR
jgi:lipoprotein NlpI